MEQWEAIIENLERPPDQCHRTFEKILETAAALLSTAVTQLAPFETEWLVDTLLHSPVELLTTVSQKRGDEVWRKAVADALKLMASVAGLSHKYYEQIVDICLLNYDPELRKHALACLAAVAKHSDAATRDFARHVQALEEATQCRAPIALLVGALCEHHPAVVCDELTRIWRGYLNMLDNYKNTDTVTKAALEGVCSLFKHFGDELPCAELNHFYDNLAKVYIEKSGCQAACYSILAEHASLFRERVSADRALRLKLWGAAPPATLLACYSILADHASLFRERVSADRALRLKLWGAAPPATLLGVYAVAQCENKTAFINILTTEVLPHTQSPSHQVKTTALRILGATKSFGDLSQFTDVHTLEYELRGKVSHADAELILWCVEYSLSNSERLLQAAILFYENLPQAVRKKIVVKGISNSPPELKRAAIQFLISQSCEDPDARVWRDLLQDDDVTVVTAVVRELADCLAAALQAVQDDEIEELPPKLSSLLRLASLVPPAHALPLRACGPQLRGLVHHAATLNAAKALLAGASDLYKSIRLHRCRDEATLHAACLALIQSPEDVDIEAGEMLTALQMIFSSDVDPKIHTEALKKFDYLLAKERSPDVDIRDVIRSLEKLRARGDRTDRDVRILHREITMFLGKHGTVDMNNNRDTWDDAVVVDLKKSLALTLPHQGSSYKVDLKTMLLLALQQEDPRALLTLLAMLCANLSSNKEMSTQRAIIRVARALANAHAAGGGDYAAHIQHAVRLCDAAGVDLLQYISSSKSCGARKLLAAALAAVCEEPDVLQRVAERASYISSSKCGARKLLAAALAAVCEEPDVLQRVAERASVMLASSECKLHQQLLSYISSSKCGARKLLAAALAAVCEEPDVLQRVAERASVMLASSECKLHQQLLSYISSSKCGARKLLAAALAAVCEEPDVLQRVAERASVMLASSESTTKRAGLDIAETILTSLENNHALSKTILPELTTLIALTYESDTKTIFKIASKAFIDKRQLFDRDTIRKTVFNLLDNVLKSNVSDVKIYKDTVKMTIEFVKNLRDVNLDEMLDVVFDISKNYVNVKTLYVLAVMKSEFDFDSEMSRKILGREDCVLLNCLLGLTIDRNDVFKMEAILKFLEEYSEGVLELKYMETIKLISDIITNFTSTLVKELHKNINLCFTSLKKHWKNTPKTIMASIQTWLNMLPIKKITESIEREHFTTEHHLHIQAFNIMSNIFDMSELISPDVKVEMAKWPKFLMKLYASGRLEEYFYEEMSYFTDIITVSLKFLTAEDVKKILKGESKNGISFGAFFIEGCFKVLTEKPFVLLEDELKECSVLLNDIVRMTVKKNFKERYGNVLELVDELWPTYEQHATFVQEHCLLANLQCLGPGPESNPLQWATRVVCSQDASLDERTKLLCFLPEEAFKVPEVSAAVSSLFPARLRELRPALLEAAAARPAALLPTVAALAGNDTSTGWWDSALESCVSASAKWNNLELCGTLFQKCQGERACERVLVPLLRHSSTDICERFLASVLDRILGNLKKGPKGKPAHPSYRKSWEEYMISLYLLLVAFEKLPTSSLESPASVLYSATTNSTPWHLVRETCSWCHQLRERLHRPMPDDQLYPMYRKLQCLIYNVMCAAICRRRPAAPLYEQLLGTDALQRIVDEKEEYVLPIRTSWTQRTKSLPVAVPLEPSTLSPSHTQRSRIFLRTLSEDPMLFDLHSSVEEQVEVQDISLVETPLNSHPCAGTLTALLRHAAGVSTLASLWRILASLLKGGTSGKNLKWLLAQVICNCKEELKPQASVLLPGLLAVLASVEEGKCMNGLHLDVLDTILYWKEDITSEDLNTITHHLIRTCMENRRKNVFDGLLRTLQGLLELYGTIQVEWNSFEAYYEDPHHDTQKALFKVIKTISKTKYIPTVVSKLVAKLDTDPSNVSECFGLAMLGSLGDILRSNGITSYVRVLYYASLGCAECCGEQEFRKIADYVTKVISHDRTKCLHILSCYLSRGRRGEHVVDMFDTIDLPHMIDKDQKALLLVKHGLPLMEDAMKRRCVAQIAALKPATVKVRKLVVEVMRKAYEELFTTPPQPPAKRQKTDSTPILTASRDDVYTNTVLTCLGVYAVDASEAAEAARDALEAHLDRDLGASVLTCLGVYSVDASEAAEAARDALEAHLDRDLGASTPYALKTRTPRLTCVSRDDVYTNSVLTCLGVYSVDASEAAEAARDALEAHLDKDLGASVLTCLGVYAVDASEAAEAARDALEAHLDKDLGAR
ncbi:uncharacterized protein LOC134676568 [Cydia fagiglandana]|uniref:uncharacterized protein LOC134676568 n=1 Tax=Cydia fagiglandana TaxID=1458189 RepID=UPI002FEE0BB8